VFVSLVIAVLVAAVAYPIFALTGGGVGNTWGFRFGPLQIWIQSLVFAVFLFSFILVWFLLYVQYNREAEDIYSRLREKLVGTWQVKYELYPNQYRHNPLEQTPTSVCEIAVDQATKKLELLFAIENHPLFESGKQVIRTISLRHEANNRYSMSYYYKMHLGLNPVVSQHLLEEENEGNVTSLEIEIFSSMFFGDVAPKQEIKLIQGEWFDLNGNLIRLFSLVSEIKEHQADEKLFRKRLSEAVISRDNFAALMGLIRFSRQ
jgi:hypothetical protein